MVGAGDLDLAGPADAPDGLRSFSRIFQDGRQIPFAEEIEHQRTQVEHLRSAMHKLDGKLTEAQAKSELLIAKHRRSRALTKASQARMAASDESKMGTFDRMKNKVQGEEAMGRAMAEMANDNVEEKLSALDKDDEIEKMLADLKVRKGVA